LAQATPSPSPAPTTTCSHAPRAIVFDDYPHEDTSKGPPPYFAVVDVRVNPDGSIEWSRIYKSSGIAEFDHESLDLARHLRYAPRAVNCTSWLGNYFFVHSPRGYSEPEFSPRP
jgi:TonB family protein